EKERQRLESLRRKQEAEEERRKKVEEEKRRRQAEMKQKREERLRKALQARERLEQMEEEKKKRMEQKILQSDEKVMALEHTKAPEERSKKKLSKKQGEAEAWKQKVLRAVRATLGPFHVVFLLLQEEGGLEQEPLQKRREDEVKEKGRRVWELRNLVEQQQAEQGKERYGLFCRGGGELELWWGGEDKPYCLRARLSQGLRGGSKRLWESEPQHVLSWEGPTETIESHSFLPGWNSASCAYTALWFQKSISASCLGPPKGTKDCGSPVVNENNYGMDLNSDDSTDDENEPRKPVPAWADGAQLKQAIVHQYYHPVNVGLLFGLIPSPKLEDIFGKSKPRYFKRTSSAVWHSPP
ncbi:INCE protein, partial [Centropus unirufus]|nr:INCE protein [Centropus unirufus]